MKLTLFACLLLMTCFLTKNQAQNNQLRCKDFKSGTFEQYVDTMKIETIRLDSIQTERTRFGEAKYSVKWISDCEYELELLSTSMIFLKDKIGRKYRVTMVETFGDKYNYEYLIIGANFLNKGTLTKIK